jgi:hypothetical protein
LIGNSSVYSYTKNQVNISNHSEKKVVTTKYVAKFQNPTTVSWQKIIQPERISNDYTRIPKNQVNISNHSEIKW